VYSCTPLPLSFSTLAPRKQPLDGQLHRGAQLPSVLRLHFFRRRVRPPRDGGLPGLLGSRLQQRRRRQRRGRRHGCARGAGVGLPGARRVGGCGSSVPLRVGQLSRLAGGRRGHHRRVPARPASRPNGAHLRAANRRPELREPLDPRGGRARAATSVILQTLPHPFCERQAEVRSGVQLLRVFFKQPRIVSMHAVSFGASFS
jgi:hypothetical protein